MEIADEHVRRTMNIIGGHSYIGNSGAVLRRSFTAAVSAVITRTYLSAQITFTPLYSRDTCPPYTFSYTMLRYPDVKGKNECGLR